MYYNGFEKNMESGIIEGELILPVPVTSSVGATRFIRGIRKHVTVMRSRCGFGFFVCGVWVPWCGQLNLNRDCR